MAKIQLTLGELNENNLVKVVTYFYGITPTNLEVPIYKLPGYSLNWGRKVALDTPFDHRIFMTSFILPVGTRIKMRSRRHEIGKRTVVTDILVEIVDGNVRRYEGYNSTFYIQAPMKLMAGIPVLDGGIVEADPNDVPKMGFLF